MKKILFLTCLSAGVLSLSAQPKVLEKAYSHKNLTIYLLQGENLVQREYITLEEALKDNKITLHETSSVNELKVDNKSSDYVFIMSGDIVKGGRQDRTISEDIVLKPRSKNIPLTSFCVEQSRWEKRGSEDVSKFTSSSNALSNRNLKIAARSSKSQSAVWAEVAEFQVSAGANAQADIRSRESATSLQLSLENKDFQKMLAEYKKALSSAFVGKQNIVGFVCCINGKMASAEWFGNVKLAGKMQPKLLESAISEAIFAYNKDLSFTACGIASVNSFLGEAQKGEETVSETGEDMLLRKREADKAIIFKSYNVSASEHPLHVSIYSTEDLKTAESSSSTNQQYQYGGFRNIRNR